MQSGLGLKDRREGVRSCGCTDEAAYVSIKDEGVVEHVAIVVLFWRELCLSLSVYVCCVKEMKEAFVIYL